jgi:DNA-binding transcriptional MerR regulator
VFTIGPFARLVGVSAKVLRSYDAVGLFQPVWSDPTSGYRYYSPAQLPEIRRIIALRDIGIGLAEIGRLVRGGADLREALERRRTELEREKREIDRRLATLDIRVEAAIDDGLDVVLRPIAAEPVAMIGMDRTDVDFGAAFYELESFVRDRRRRAHGPPGMLVDDSDADGTEIFVPVTRPIRPAGRIRPDRLAACRAATVIQRGPYDGIAEARRALDRWIAAAGLVPAGPLRIVYLQFGVEPELRIPRGYHVDRATDLVTELQLPVE